MIALDLGSNTLRVIEYDCTSKEFGKSFERIVRTAEGLVENGQVGDAALHRIIDAIMKAKKTIDFASQEIYAVTTEAIRRASNAQSILATIEEKTGLRFEIISAEREAILTLLAIENRLELLESRGERSFVLVDIGGGSTELTLCCADHTITKSFPIGIVTVAEKYKSLEKIKEVLPQLMCDMSSFVHEAYNRYGVVESFIATAGTPTTLAAMKLGQNYTTYDPKVVNGTKLTTGDLDREMSHLLSLGFADREELVGVGRSDLIAAGILIFRELFALVNLDECVVIDDGLREGVALQGCQNQNRR